MISSFIVISKAHRTNSGIPLVVDCRLAVYMFTKQCHNENTGGLDRFEYRRSQLPNQFILLIIIWLGPLTTSIVRKEAYLKSSYLVGWFKIAMVDWDSGPNPSWSQLPVSSPQPCRMANGLEVIVINLSFTYLSILLIIFIKYTWQIVKKKNVKKLNS